MKKLYVSKIVYTQMIIRPDFIFSYWIFIWFLLYKVDLIQYNPKKAIILAIFFNVIICMYMIYKKIKKYSLVKFISINAIIKIIPLLYIYDTKTDVNDDYFLLFISCLYLIWIYINDETDPYIKLIYGYINDNSKDMNDKDDNITTPLGYYYDKIYHSLLFI